MAVGRVNVSALAAREIMISMDGRGAWRDKVIVERLWRIIKCGEVYLWASASVSEAGTGISCHLGFYDSRIHLLTRAPRSSLLQPENA
ncbi:hypothetical protein D2T30_05050 [Sinirhodobacter populi]|uniref:Transposase n=1 Tax=Paenirhodobacter populi TaxID=2306993 RepID=A0A443JR88_9RHOB|nr:hypothetical protein D2T30_05050 [Sinirhodobacter populi]